MITGSTTWKNALAASYKQPLYLLTVVGINLTVASYSPQTLVITYGGYGVLPYGTAGYGI